MNKIDFPLGVELPLRGGGVAVLYEFFEGKWLGRMRSLDGTWPTYGNWVMQSWGPDGALFCDEPCAQDILPPKRKAWVVWYPPDCVAPDVRHKPAEIVTSVEYAGLRAKELGGTYQEITEP